MVLVQGRGHAGLALDIADDAPGQHLGAAHGIPVVEGEEAEPGQVEQGQLPALHQCGHAAVLGDVVDVAKANKTHDTSLISIGSTGRIWPRLRSKTMLSSASSVLTKLLKRLSFSGSCRVAFHSHS